MKKLFSILLIVGTANMIGCAGAASMSTSDMYLMPDGTYRQGVVSRSNDLFGPSVVSQETLVYKPVGAGGELPLKEKISMEDALKTGTSFVRVDEDTPSVSAAGSSVVQNVSSLTGATAQILFSARWRPHQTNVSANGGNTSANADADARAKAEAGAAASSSAASQSP